MDTLDAVESTTGGLDAKAEKIIHARTMIAPSKHTPAWLLINVKAVFCVLSAAASGTGDIAVYMYSLKNLPYTVKIITKDNIVINIEPSKVTAHNGIDSRKPVLLGLSRKVCI